MIIVDQLPAGTPGPTSRRDTVALTWEDRSRTRQRVRTVEGRDLAIKLPTGTRLIHGTVVLIGDGYHVEIEAAPEEVWVIRADEERTLLRIAWELGNRHFPACFSAGQVTARYDHTLEELWRRLGVRAERDHQPFLAEPHSAHGHG